MKVLTNDGKNWTFEKAYNFLQDHLELTPIEEILYIRLCRRRHQGPKMRPERIGDELVGVDRSYIRTSQVGLAKEFNLSRTTLQRALGRLERAGLIQVHASRGNNGFNGGSLIQIKNVDKIPALKQVQELQMSILGKPQALRNHNENMSNQNNQRAFSGITMGISTHDITSRNNLEINSCKKSVGHLDGPQDIKYQDNTSRTSAASKTLPGEVERPKSVEVLNDCADKVGKLDDFGSHNLSYTAKSAYSYDNLTNSESDKSDFSKMKTPSEMPLISPAMFHSEKNLAQREYSNEMLREEQRLYVAGGGIARGNLASALNEIRRRYRGQKEIEDEYFAYFYLKRFGTLESGDRPQDFYGYFIAYFLKLAAEGKKYQKIQIASEKTERERKEKQVFDSKIGMQMAEKMQRFELLDKNQKESLISLIRSEHARCFPWTTKIGSFTEKMAAVALWDEARDYFTAGLGSV